MRNLHSLRQSICILTPLMCGLLAGCHGGPKTDVIERELRWQEDQIYTLEDYLMEYQAKVRRLRCENESLRQSLAKAKTTKTQPAGETSELPLPDQPDKTIRPERSLLQNPSPAGSKRNKSDSLDLEMQEIEVPLVPELGVPDTPDLEGKTPSPSADRNGANRAPMVATAETPEKIRTDEQLSNSQVTTPTTEPDLPPWITAVPGPTISKATQPLEFSGSPPKEPADRKAEVPGYTAPEEEKQTESEEVGVVLDNDAAPGPFKGLGGGQESELLQTPQHEDPIVVPEVPNTSLQPTNVRLEVDLDSNRKRLDVTITPLAADQQPTAFKGTASLMLRDPHKPGGPLHEVRWDFDSDQVQSAWGHSSQQQSLCFSLPLPEALPTDRPIEFWARLMATAIEGPTKILDHVVLQPVELQISTPIGMESDWAIAKPGEPGLLETKVPGQTSPEWQARGARAIFR